MNLRNFRSRFARSAIGRSIRILSRADRQKLSTIVLIQIFMGWLDLLGVLAIGLLGALSVTGLQSQSPGDRVTQALRFLHISNTQVQTFHLHQYP